MLTSIPVSTAILVVSIVLFVVMCYKGVHTATAALIASAIMAFGTTDGWMTTMTTTWVTGVGTFASQFALAFMSAGIFSYLMRETKCGEAIGQTFIKYVGGDNAPFILAIVAAIL